MQSFSFSYDLSLDMRPISGSGASFSEDGVIRITKEGSEGSEGSEVFELPASQITEAVVKAGVGCGLLFVKLREGTDLVLCRFTMSCMRDAGEFCKIVNYYIKTNVYEGSYGSFGDIFKKTEKRVCEKCGRAFIEGMNVCIFCYDKLSVIKRALSLMRPYAKQIIFAQIMISLSTILYLLVPAFNRYLIDSYLRPQIGTWQQLLLLTGFMLLARAFGEVIFILNSRLFNKAAIAYCNDLRTTAYGKLQSLSMHAFSKRSPGDLIRRIMDDTGNIRDFITDGGRWVIEQVFMFVIVIVILLLSDVRLTLLVFAPVPFVMYFLSKFWKVIRSRYERQWRKESKCSSILHDIIKGIRTVKAFGNERVEIEKFSAANRDLAQICSDNEALWARLFPLLTFFTGIGEILVLYFGGRAVVGETLSLGVLVQFTMYIGFIYSPLRWIVSFPRWLANATTSMVKVFEIFDEEADIAEKESSLAIPVSGGVRFDNVSFGYKTYEPVLKGINLEIEPGEMIGLVGRSGVGKSTLINLVMRLYDPNNGAITINGTDLRDISPKHLHENIGVVFQDNFLFAGSYYDNIMYAKPDAAPHEIIAAAKAANAHDFIMQTADGYNTQIGEGGQTISGGERQRLSIARAIIKNPDILILDEATSSLDVETEAAIQDSLAKLIKGRTTIAIAHRLSTLRNANRLVVLDEGVVAEEGTHIELLRKKGIYYKLVMAQRQTADRAGRAEAN